MTVAQMIQRCMRRLLSYHRAAANRLTDTIDNDDLVLTLSFDDQAPARGTLLEIDTELMLVLSYNTSSRVASVQRGYLGTTAAAHTADATVTLDPRFPLADVMDTIKDEVASWPPRVFRVETSTVSLGINPTVDLDAPPKALYPLSIIRHNYTGEYRWYRMEGRAEHGLPVSEFPSGWGFFPDTNAAAIVDLEVTWASEFDLDAFDDATDLEGDCGLTVPMFDVIPYGVAWRMLAGKENVRSGMESQPEPRFSQDVLAGAAAGAAQMNQQMRDSLLANVAIGLLARYPVFSR
jgi:hypothetical protein